eukprot:GDKI01010120.1.p2 GENE.GDKI01010120.1~~GDKI01010120.1.p2  ORF type:complete len:173 (-),score=62.05 GDKI01010120.1:27-545(-)
MELDNEIEKERMDGVWQKFLRKAPKSHKKVKKRKEKGIAQTEGGKQKGGKKERSGAAEARAVAAKKKAKTAKKRAKKTGVPDYAAEADEMMVKGVTKLPKTSVTRLMMAAGLTSNDKGVLRDVRVMLEQFSAHALQKAACYASNDNRRRINASDAVHGLKHMGVTVWGEGGR